jgi:hypothetical protein
MTIQDSSLNGHAALMSYGLLGSSSLCRTDHSRWHILQAHSNRTRCARMVG